ncbi:VOC family protein [Geitlerinema sp. PCC 9228]|jgi:catechol 2,3-dioxygenase-like lactoylglutathione lyase family enzyme|uniref:VOC family protein n=1 Tax=Geitlerinema sp. PCC 9228 TaxID=111611 RepID=UPI0008F9D928|nr:VOC family protein [Geitlerinema sp. PCC 9228]
MAAQFKHVMLMVPDVEAAAKFYSEGLGLEVKTTSSAWAELDADGTTIALHAAREQSQPSNSPILSFRVDDIYAAIQTLESQGAYVEGDVREPSFGKVAAVRTPDGHLVSLLQPAAVSASS